MRYFAHAVPGLGDVLRDEIEETVPAEPVASDGRNDAVAFEAPGTAPPALRTAEDVFAEVGATRAEDLRAVVDGTATPEGLERALSTYANVAGPLQRRMGFRIVARVRSERAFTRTRLRDSLRDRIQRLRPQWFEDDPAPLELWLAPCGEVWRLGLRLTGADRSRRSSRDVERTGALRPSVAAAMVRLAGGPVGPLCDPFCGSGTILTEAAAAGHRAVGADLDPHAAETARRNGAPNVVVADARRSPFGNGAFAAVVSNLPFGRRFPLPRPRTRFASAVTDELVRIVRPRGSIVVLTGEEALGDAVRRHDCVTVTGRREVRLLGRGVQLWALRRVAG